MVYAIVYDIVTFSAVNRIILYSHCQCGNANVSHTDRWSVGYLVNGKTTRGRPLWHSSAERTAEAKMNFMIMWRMTIKAGKWCARIILDGMVELLNPNAQQKHVCISGVHECMVIFWLVPFA